MGSFLHLQERGKNFLASRVQQERGLAILTRAPDCTDEMPEQPASHIRRIRNRSLASRQLTRPQPGNCPFTSNAADGLGKVQLRRITHAAVPVVALHLVSVLRNQRATDRVAGTSSTSQESEGVAVHANVTLRVDGRAFGIRDAGVHSPSCRFTTKRKLNGLLRFQSPRM